jgi:hypothetical protein
MYALVILYGDEQLHQSGIKLITNVSFKEALSISKPRFQHQSYAFLCSDYHSGHRFLERYKTTLVNKEVKTPQSIQPICINRAQSRFLEGKP